MVPKWFFPATRLTRELRKAGYKVDVDRFVPLFNDDYDETDYFVYSKPDNDGYRDSIAYYTTNIPWEGLRIQSCADPEAAKIIEKYAKIPAKD
jgi:hypothetical protein